MWRWVFLGCAAAATLLILRIQLDRWLRARRMGFDPSRYATEEPSELTMREPFTRADLFRQSVAVRWVGIPLAAGNLALFASFALAGMSWITYPLWGLAALLLAPVRRTLNLKAFSVIANSLVYDPRPPAHRDGTAVVGRPLGRLVLTWYRHEYTGHDLFFVYGVKYFTAVGHLLCWPLTLLVVQTVHVMTCRLPWDALGHQSDFGEGPGRRLRSATDQGELPG
ncbi:hypothetical protein [Streptomyces sp. NPDC050263]|uniref:hypothetical protein n=1 Tax=Streptomyces sp. NPDC050263 TaxID=3155037 RepID=UPI003434DCE8